MKETDTRRTSLRKQGGRGAPCSTRRVVEAYIGAATRVGSWRLATASEKQAQGGVRNDPFY
ncbi:hypothetical protein GCM10010317_010760 [Streptomyces mirabilis]|nr:hypothetical protein GCM10010317_010760 [Streptomyces mirabilis]